MIRPARRRSMPRSAARVRRNGAVRSTSSTACQSSSFMRSASMSRVRPALLTRMCQRAGRRFGRRDQRVGRGRVAQVGGADMRALAEFRGQRLQRLPPRAGQHHRRALRVQRAGDRGADAARGAGDQRRLAVQPEHFSSAPSRRDVPRFQPINPPAVRLCPGDRRRRQPPAEKRLAVRGGARAPRWREIRRALRC